MLGFGCIGAALYPYFLDLQIGMKFVSIRVLLEHVDT